MIRLEEILKKHNIDYSQTNTYEIEKRMQRQFEEDLREELMQKRKARVERAIKESGLDRMLKTKTFDSYIAKEDWQKIAKMSCMKYAENPNRWLLVCGQSGSGKTHLCTAIVSTLIAKEIPVWYMLYREEINRLKNMNGNDPEERERKMRLYKGAEVLYIDDLFKGSASKSDVATMFDLLDARRRTDKLTIISTEYNPDELKAIDEGVAGRITENTKKVMINWEEGRNYRMRA